jgi:hypothetical protein
MHRKDQSKKNDLRSDYRQPELKMLGMVRDLTLNGSGVNAETPGVGQGSCEDPNFKFNKGCKG